MLSLTASKLAYRNKFYFLFLSVGVVSSDVSFWANYGGGGHKCLPVNTTGGTQVSSWANYRVGHFEILSPYFPCHA